MFGLWGDSKPAPSADGKKPAQPQQGQPQQPQQPQAQMKAAMKQGSSGDLKPRPTARSEQQSQPPQPKQPQQEQPQPSQQPKQPQPQPQQGQQPPQPQPQQPAQKNQSLPQPAQQSAPSKDDEGKGGKVQTYYREPSGGSRRGSSSALNSPRTEKHEKPLQLQPESPQQHYIPQSLPQPHSQQPQQHQQPQQNGFHDEDDGEMGDKELLTLLEGRLRRYRATKQRLQHVEKEKGDLELENSDLRSKLLEEQRANVALSKEVEMLSAKLASILQNVAKLSSSVPDDSPHPHKKNLK